MASPLNSVPTFGEHQIEACQWLLGYMRAQSIRDYANARDALGKSDLAYRLKALKDLPQEVLAMVLQEAEVRGPKRLNQPARPQAQPAQAKSLKRPRTDADANETSTLKPVWQLDLSYFAVVCNKSHKCTESWVRKKCFQNHFQTHLLSTRFKAQNGSNDWVCDPDTCKETFVNASDFTAHIWEKHMRTVSRQWSGVSDPSIGVPGYSPISHSVSHTPGDDSTFSPHSTAFSPLPSITPHAMTPNATGNRTAPFTTPAPTQLPVETRSAVPFGRRPVGAFPSNGYMYAMHGNNNDMSRDMSYGNPPYSYDPHMVMPNNNGTHSNVGQNTAPAFGHDMTGWPDQPFPAMPSSYSAAGQSYPAHPGNNFNNSNGDPPFG